MTSKASIKRITIPNTHDYNPEIDDQIELLQNLSNPGEFTVHVDNIIEGDVYFRLFKKGKRNCIDMGRKQIDRFINDVKMEARLVSRVKPV